VWMLGVVPVYYAAFFFDFYIVTFISKIYTVAVQWGYRFWPFFWSPSS
jgi:hypothetical protein